MKKMTISKAFFRKNMGLLIGIAVAAVFAGIFSNNNYLLLIGGYICMYSVVTSALDILFGFCGQISFGHAAFFCVGAYASACLNRYFQIPVIVTMLLGAVIAAAVGALIAWPSTNLVYHFLSLATIAFAAIVNQVARVSPGGFTGNAVGFKTAPIMIFGINCTGYFEFFIFSFLILFLTILIKRNLINSRIGRAFIAIRENGHAANGMGINVRKYKVIAFATSAFFTGYAGAMFVHLATYIVPDQFKQTLSALFVTMLMFGGTGSLLGPIIGAAAIQLLTELLRRFEDWQMLIYGVLLLLVIIAFPGGLYGAFRKHFHALLSKWKKNKTQSESEADGSV